jgi:hypothetical protein
MLAVSVHDGDVWCGVRQHSLYACRGEATPADPLNAANPRIPLRDFTNSRRCSVRRIVVYENHFPRFSPKAFLKPTHKLKYIVSLVKSWDDYRQLGNLSLGGTCSVKQLGYFSLHIVLFSSMNLICRPSRPATPSHKLRSN